jgi:hypothetical protein
VGVVGEGEEGRKGGQLGWRCGIKWETKPEAEHIRFRGLEHVHLVRTARGGGSRGGSSAVHSFSESERGLLIANFPSHARVLGPARVLPGSCPVPRARLWGPIGGCVRRACLAGHRAFFLATRIEEAPHAVSGGAGAPPPPITTTPINQRLTPPSTHYTHWARLVSNMGHRPPQLGVLVGQ